MFAELDAVSFTVTVTLNAPVLDGVPPMTPVVGPMLIPPGRPVADQVYDPLPPLAVTVVAGYAKVTVPAGSVAGPETVSAA